MYDLVRRAGIRSRSLVIHDPRLARTRDIMKTKCVYCEAPATTHVEEDTTWVPVCETCRDVADADAYERACLSRVAPFDGD